MTAAPAPAVYTLRAIEQMLGLKRHAVMGLVDAGFVTPARGPRNAWRFTFQDVVLLRTAHALRAAEIPPRRLLRSLRQLRARLPAELPLSGLRIRAIGSEVAVRAADAAWESDAGQLLLDFEVSGEAGGGVAIIAADSAAAAFARGERLEAVDADAAELAYVDALRIDPGHAEAAINLGALLCEQGRCDEAIALYDSAVAHRPGNALLHYNRAVALEDGGRAADALASYEATLALDATLADAHFNAARLHEQLGRPQQALRHYSAYRRLQK